MTNERRANWTRCLAGSQFCVGADANRRLKERERETTTKRCEIVAKHTQTVVSEFVINWICSLSRHFRLSLSVLCSCLTSCLAPSITEKERFLNSRLTFWPASPPSHISKQLVCVAESNLSLLMKHQCSAKHGAQKNREIKSLSRITRFISSAIIIESMANAGEKNILALSAHNVLS
jgi:hypothetical protein